MEKLILNYLGDDFLGIPTYKDENGKLFKDVNCDNGILDICTVSGNFEDGDPNTPISQIKKYQNLEIEIIGREEEPTREEKFNYQMLGRLKSDCDYYLGYGNHSAKNLWGITEQNHIEEMKKIYNWFDNDKKPEWLTYEQILEYKNLMIN